MSSLFDVLLSTSTFLEMICGITLTEFLFNFFITFLILVTVYVFYIYIYVSKRSVFISEINSIVCYLSLVAIKLNIRSRYMFGIKSFKNARIWFVSDNSNLYWTMACRYWSILLAFTYNQSDQFIMLRFFKNTKYFFILFKSILLFIITATQ